MDNLQFEQKLDKVAEAYPLKLGRKYIGKRKVVYLCLPFTGNVQEYAEKAACVSEIAYKSGYIVLTPYLSMKDRSGTVTGDLEFASECAVRLIEVCDQFWVVKDMMEPNVLFELIRAVKLGKNINFVGFVEEKTDV